MTNHNQNKPEIDESKFPLTFRGEYFETKEDYENSTLFDEPDAPQPN